MVVPVLMTSCQVSLKPKIGPVTAQTTMMATQAANVMGLPAAWATALQTSVKNLETDIATPKSLTPEDNAQLEQKSQRRGSAESPRQPRGSEPVRAESAI